MILKESVRERENDDFYKLEGRFDKKEIRLGLIGQRDGDSQVHVKTKIEED